MSDKTSAADEEDNLEEVSGKLFFAEQETINLESIMEQLGYDAHIQEKEELLATAIDKMQKLLNIFSPVFKTIQMKKIKNAQVFGKKLSLRIEKLAKQLKDFYRIVNEEKERYKYKETKSVLIGIVDYTKQIEKRVTAMENDKSERRTLINEAKKINEELLKKCFTLDNMSGVNEKLKQKRRKLVIIIQKLQSLNDAQQKKWEDEILFEPTDEDENMEKDILNENISGKP